MFVTCPPRIGLVFMYKTRDRRKGDLNPQKHMHVRANHQQIEREEALSVKDPL